MLHTFFTKFKMKGVNNIFWQI